MRLTEVSSGLKRLAYFVRVPGDLRVEEVLGSGIVSSANRLEEEVGRYIKEAREDIREFPEQEYQTSLVDVMEVKGKELAERVRSGSLSLEEAVEKADWLIGVYFDHPGLIEPEEVSGLINSVSVAGLKRQASWLARKADLPIEGDEVVGIDRTIDTATIKFASGAEVSTYVKEWFDEQPKTSEDNMSLAGISAGLRREAEASSDLARQLERARNKITDALDILGAVSTEYEIVDVNDIINKLDTLQEKLKSKMHKHEPPWEN